MHTVGNLWKGLCINRWITFVNCGQPAPLCGQNVDGVWIEKYSPGFRHKPLRGSRRRRKNTFTVGNGYHSGGNSGDVAEIGKPVSAAGTRHQRVARGAWEARQLADLAQRGYREAPSISYMEGALLYSTSRYLEREQRVDHYRTARAERRARPPQGPQEY